MFPPGVEVFIWPKFLSLQLDHTLASVVAAPNITVPAVQMAPHLLRMAELPAGLHQSIHPSELNL